MEFIKFDSTNLAEFLSTIPDESKNGLPFGLIKLDLQGTVLEYNMAESDMMGVDASWAIGKNFFNDVATCTKPKEFYGRFKEGVEKGFLNTVFDYVFNHRGIVMVVKVTMITMPDHLGKKSVMVMIKRANKPHIEDAITQPSPASSPAVLNALQASLKGPSANFVELSK